ncbi:cell division FtsZ family protein [Patescibacteria group bacterium]|nr:cell division FtsZ family protein [Patescibacteria group bacterium]
MKKKRLIKKKRVVGNKRQVKGIKKIKKAKRIVKKFKLRKKAGKTRKKTRVKRFSVRQKKILRRIKPKKSKFLKTRSVKPKPIDFASPVSAVFKPKIKVIGIGGGGGSIVSEIGKTLEKTSFVIVDTDIRAIKKKPGIKYFYFGEALTHGLGTGMNPDLAKEAAEKEKERIAKLLEGQDIVILVASLGGGLGSGASPVFAEISRSLDNVTLGIFTLPFKFEGKKKAKIGQRALQNLKEHVNALVTIPNERIFKIIDEKTSITEAFSLVNKNLIASLESLIDLIYNPGLINIDFADLRTILKGRGMMAFLNSVEASGKARADEIVDKILKNPLFNNNIKAEKILFNIAGGNSLGMVEVERISKQIADLNPQAKIIFGISRNLKAKNRIKTTLLITGPSLSVAVKPETEKKIPVKAEKKKKELEVVKTKKVKAKKKELKTASVKNSIPITVGTLLDQPTEKKEKKAMIRRTALEAKKVQEIEENKRLDQEAEWEIPAFLRKMRFKA